MYSIDAPHSGKATEPGLLHIFLARLLLGQSVFQPIPEHFATICPLAPRRIFHSPSPRANRSEQYLLWKIRFWSWMRPQRCSTSVALQATGSRLLHLTVPNVGRTIETVGSEYQDHVSHLTVCTSAGVVSLPTVKRQVPMAHSLRWKLRALPKHGVTAPALLTPMAWRGEASDLDMPLPSLGPRPPERGTCAPHRLKLSTTSTGRVGYGRPNTEYLICLAAVACCSGRSGNIIADL